MQEVIQFPKYNYNTEIKKWKLKSFSIDSFSKEVFGFAIF